MGKRRGGRGSVDDHDRGGVLEGSSVGSEAGGGRSDHHTGGGPTGLAGGVGWGQQ